MALEKALQVFEAADPVRTIDWAIANATTEYGAPYSHFAYPHLSAPGGPFDALDSNLYRDIWLQWGSRLGKTFGGQVAMMKRADTEPCPMMFASSTEDLGVGVVTRTYGMLEHCARLRDQLAPPARRKQNRIDLRFCRVYVAWSRSVSTLADKPVRFGHANEIDKWEHQSTSKEADPLKLFDDRFKEFPTFCRWKEGTPAVKSSSRIERGRLASCNAAYWVPCPHCGRYQTLQMERIEWDKNEAGKSDKDLARRTARYVCGHCDKPILDEHRGPMMRYGVWVPEGCGVNDQEARRCAAEWHEPGRKPWGGWSDAPWITGTPLRDGQDYGSQLSSLYALARSWGDVAAEWIDCQKNPQNLRNFINQWLAQTWEFREAQMTWEVLGKRVITEEPRYAVPEDCPLLVCGADIQHDHIVYVVDAWGDGRRSHTLDYGELDTLDDLLEIITRPYHHANGKTPHRVDLTLIDSGFHPRDVYQFCRECSRRSLKVWPCKGSSTALNAPYRESRLSEDTLAPGAPILHVDTLTTQDWFSHQIRLKADEDGAGTLFSASLAEHQDFLEQLLNEACVQKLGTNNVTKEAWERIDETIPNDYRDCRRYSFAAMLRVTKGRDIPKRQQAAKPIRRTERKSDGGVTFLERPGGWVPRR
jgi:phage terminase large subunit GpA-like protein